MKALGFALLLVAGSAGIAAADGWIDCNGPDKNGRGCDTSGASATTGAGLLLVSAVAYAVGRKRR